jgi:hypothetical protein
MAHGATKGKPGKTTCGGVLRDSNRNLIAVFMENI